MGQSELFLAHRTQNPVEAHALAAHLEAEGYDVRVVGDFLGGAFGGLNAGGMITAEVWVAAKDRDAVEPLVAAWRADAEVGDAVAPTEPASTGASSSGRIWIPIALAVGLTAAWCKFVGWSKPHQVVTAATFWGFIVLVGAAVSRYLSNDAPHGEEHELQDSSDDHTQV